MCSQAASLCKDDNAMSEWFSALPYQSRLRFNEPMSRHCSWRVGGAAAVFFEPADSAELLTFIRGVPSAIDICWLGLGSNLLIRDAGFKGIVISTCRALGTISTDGACFKAAAGVPCAKLARQVALAGYAGAEFLAGIPGTVGGALAMNAGAFGSEIWSFVSSVETIDRTGTCRTRLPAEYQIGYRTVEGPAAEWFLGGNLVFQESTHDPVARSRALLAQRSTTQPTGAPSCGSVFRNPPGDYAGRLIEAAGFKGYRVGGCHVSDKHANFIINDANASASDIESLIETLRAAIQQRFGIRLDPEVRLLGEHPSEGAH